jgi:tetratricopeptide (TPR) repeat protein
MRCQFGHFQNCSQPKLFLTILTKLRTADRLKKGLAPQKRDTPPRSGRTRDVHIFKSAVLNAVENMRTEMFENKNVGALYSMGDERLGIKKDTDKAVKLLQRAAELGSAEACGYLGFMYGTGEGVNKDETKAKQYYEKGAIGGCAHSRFNLGNIDAIAGRFDRAIKHWLIAASGGEYNAVNEIKKAMIWGYATRDHYTQALRGYKLYMDEVRSDQRDAAVTCVLEGHNTPLSSSLKSQTGVTCTPT